MSQASEIFSGKILFVCSGTSKGCCTAAIEEQARVLKKQGAKVLFFRISGKGLLSYLRAIRKLRYFLVDNSHDVVHAHYGLSGMVAWLAGANPLVVSLMGSDVFGVWWLFCAIRIFTKFLWPVTIVKSEKMAAKLGAKKVKIIPNGVDMDLFCEISKTEARSRIGFNSSPFVLWPADPEREVKNVSLALAAMDRVKDRRCEIRLIFDQPTNLMPLFYNAANVVLLTSKWEGSPNVVKEALACNVPVVSTSVGDVSKWLKNIDGCVVCASNPDDIALGIERALNHNGRINGRDRIKELDNENITKKLFSVYTGIMQDTPRGTRK